MPFELPKLKFAFGDLEPHIDAQTVEIHYSKHHQTYINNLTKALETHTAYASWSAEKLVRELNSVPEEIRTGVRNNAGGFLNHNLYWATLSKTPKAAPSGRLADNINSTFGNFADFKSKLTQAGLTRFGSGWAWLVWDTSKKLDVISTPNQDSPLLDGHTPLLGVDVWEHAYYLKYQNRRNEYIEAWWNLVDWLEVEKIYESL